MALKTEFVIVQDDRMDVRVFRSDDPDDPDCKMVGIDTQADEPIYVRLDCVSDLIEALNRLTEQP